MKPTYCTCDACQARRDRESDGPLDLVGLGAAIVLPLLAILGVIAAWWVQQR